MDVKSVGIYIWRGKAYIPTYGQVQGGGMFVATDPVFVANLVKGQLVQAIEAALAHGHPPVSDRSRDEWEQLMKTSPLLTATGARSWREFYRGAIHYTIEWGPAGTFLESGRRAREGGWQFDPERRRVYPADVEIARVVDAVLKDVQSRRIGKPRLPP